MALIQDSIFDSAVDEVFDQLANSGIEYNGTSIDGFIKVNSENEKRMGADSDIEVEFKIDELDNIVSGISKSDIITYGGIDYDNVLLVAKTDYDYYLKAFKVLS